MGIPNKMHQESEGRKLEHFDCGPPESGDLKIDLKKRYICGNGTVVHCECGSGYTNPICMVKLHRTTNWGLRNKMDGLCWCPYSTCDIGYSSKRCHHWRKPGKRYMVYFYITSLTAYNSIIISK